MEQAISSDLIRGHIDTIILHTLLDGDKFAQQITDFIENKSENCYQINQATLYSSLKRLENLKYVKSYWNDFDSGRRKFFSITQLGKDVVDKNLSSWTFSKDIIDKLLDSKQEKNIVYVEKIVEKPIDNNISKSNISNNVQSTLSSNEKIQEYFDNIEKNKALEEKNKESFQELSKIDEKPNTEQLKEEIKDVNFRYIINCLINTDTNAKNTTEASHNNELEPLNVENLEHVKSFNETIEDKNFALDRSNLGKIDFGDITLKAAKEGYKVRISSVNSAKTSGGLYINKLNCFTSICFLFLVLLEIFVLKFAFNVNFSTPIILICTILTTISPFYFVVMCITNSKKTIVKKKFSDNVLTMGVFVFNFIIITLALNLFIGTNFYNNYMLINRVVLPLILFVDLFLFSIAQAIFSKLKIFYVKIKK